MTIQNGTGTGSGLSMRKSFKSTLTRLSDGGGRRMRKTSRTSMLGDKDGGISLSDPSGRPGSSRASSPSTNTSQAQIQALHQQHRGLGIGRPDMDSGGTVKKLAGPRDTHYFDTVAEYSGLSIPIRVPLSIFPEEVGDVGSHYLRCFPGLSADASLCYLVDSTRSSSSSRRSRPRSRSLSPHLSILNYTRRALSHIPSFSCSTRY